MKMPCELKKRYGNTTIMKYFAILCAVFVVAVAVDKELQDNFIEKLIVIFEDCGKEVGASGDDIEELVNYKLPSTHEGKCLVACMQKKLGIQNADGKLNLVGSIAIIEPIKESDPDVYERAKLVFEKCTSTVSNDADECITGANMLECCQKVGMEHGFTEKYILASS